jgi:hypothetical protein
MGTPEGHQKSIFNTSKVKKTMVFHWYERVFGTFRTNLSNLKNWLVPAGEP